MPLNVTKETEQEIEAKVRAGEYHSADEVIREGLRLLKERDRLYALRLEELRGEVKKGLDQLDRGEGRPLDVSALKLRIRSEISGQTKESRRPAVRQHDPTEQRYLSDEEQRAFDRHLKLLTMRP